MFYKSQVSCYCYRRCKGQPRKLQIMHALHDIITKYPHASLKKKILRYSESTFVRHNEGIHMLRIQALSGLNHLSPTKG